ncbi:MAG: Uma2 family endonuclease [Burkholderiales bacterium]
MNAPQRFQPDPRVQAAIEYGLSLRLDGPRETNGQGQIIMNRPIGLLHAKRADKLIAAIRTCLPDWRIWPEIGIHTADGVKAPDLAVVSPQFAESTDPHGFLLQAPDICVEIMSPSNSWEEIRHKGLLYLAAGAAEAWVCDENGELHFFGGGGEMPSSQIAATVPRSLE